MEGSFITTQCVTLPILVVQFIFLCVWICLSACVCSTDKKTNSFTNFISISSALLLRAVICGTRANESTEREQSVSFDSILLLLPFLTSPISQRGPMISKFENSYLLQKCVSLKKNYAM